MTVDVPVGASGVAVKVGRKVAVGLAVCASVAEAVTVCVGAGVVAVGVWVRGFATTVGVPV